MRLLKYAFPYRWRWALVLVVTLAGSAASLLQPWPIKVLVDNALGGHPMSGGLALLAGWLPGTRSPVLLAGWAALAGLLIFVLISAVDVLLTRASVLVGQRMVYDLARDLFSRLQRRSLASHSRRPVGDLVAVVATDAWSVNTVVESALLAPARVLVSSAAMLIVMASMNGGLTAIAVAIAPFVAAASVLGRNRLRSASREKRRVLGEMQAHVQQTLTGISVVQAFSGEERERTRFKSLAADSVRLQLQALLAGSRVKMGSGLVETTGTAVVLWAGAIQVMQGRLTVGGLLVFLSYLGSLTKQMSALSDAYASLQIASAGVDRAAEVLLSSPEVREVSGARALPRLCGRVSVEAVTFGYVPDRPVLQEVSLEASPGQTIAIVGPTGSGKSTLVGLLPRFYDPWRGRVLLDGVDVRQAQIKSVREQVSLVLQEPFLFPMSVAENIAYGRPQASRQEIEAAAKAANAHEFIVGLPEGYETVVGERGATLSGGERQRVSIARALLKDAPVLILDEPTSALDAETEALLLEALERLMEGRTTFIIAHRLSTIRRADRIVVLREGCIAEEGTHEELMRGDGHYARSVRKQHADLRAGGGSAEQASGTRS